MIVITFETIQDRSAAHLLLQDFDVSHSVPEYKKKAFKKSYPQIILEREDDLERLRSLLSSRGIGYHEEST